MFPQGPKLLPKHRVKSFLVSGRSLETPVEPHLDNAVKTGLVDLLGARSYFGSKVLTAFCYTLGNICRTPGFLQMFCCLPAEDLEHLFLWLQMWRSNWMKRDMCCLPVITMRCTKGKMFERLFMLEKC